MNSDLDAGIEHNVDAALIQSKLHHGVSFAVKNHVVTLSGEVDSPSRRRETERGAKGPKYATALLEMIGEAEASSCFAFFCGRNGQTPELGERSPQRGPRPGLAGRDCPRPSIPSEFQPRCANRPAPGQPRERGGSSSAAMPC
jgi:hypothetical protein